MFDSAFPIDELRRRIADEGFVLTGIAPAVDSSGYNDLLRWIELRYVAGMDYFANRIDAYRHPQGVLPGAKSLVVLAFPYSAASPKPTAGNHGRTARYTWSGDDYHDVIHPKLKRLCRFIRETAADSNARGVVDTAPLMEREAAVLAGLGWRGKNTLLLNKQLGSYFFLACVLVDIELPYDRPHATDHCGTCTACLDVCPTDAFPKAGVLDASRCVSYLTIEHDGPIEVELREGIGEWLFGCDLCQEVCPWNRKPERRAEPVSAERGHMELTSLFELTDESFRAKYRKTPFWRTKRRGLLRNAAIVLGNTGTEFALPALQRGLQDPEEIVVDACQWAIDRIKNRGADSHRPATD